MLPFDPLPVLTSLVIAELAHRQHISMLDPRFLELTPDTFVDDDVAALIAQMFHLPENALVRHNTLQGWSEIVSHSFLNQADHLTFRTSGSTGTPKRCVHLVAHLLQETQQHLQSLGSCRRVLSLIPLHHLYGFIWSALLPAQLGVPCLDVRRWTPARIAQETQSGDLIVAVPTGWQQLSQVQSHWPPDTLGATSGAPCPPTVFQALTQAGLHLIEIYGASETAAVGTRTHPGHAFQLLPYWITPTAGHCISRLHPDQKNTCVFPIQDELHWLTDRTFHVGARLDGAIQIKGRNVFPDQNAHLIGTHPAVQQCSIRPTEAAGGIRLRASIIWHETASSEQRSEPELRHWLKTKLQPFEQPIAFDFR